MPVLHPTFNSSNELPVIGWREPASLPQWGIENIKTKIDTGARTSAIHVDNIEELPDDRVRFDVVVSMENGVACRSVPVETTIVRTSAVRSSSGRRQPRLVVKTNVRLGEVEREIELSLVSRHRMTCRLLLGRTALAHAFLVDPTAKCRLSHDRQLPNGRVARPRQ